MAEKDDSKHKADPRIICFERKGDERAFETSCTSLIAALQKRSRSLFVSDENVQRINHGGNWAHPAKPDPIESSMKSITAETLIPFKDIAENDLGLIGRCLMPMSESMERQFSENMYEMMGAAAESVGNVVDARGEGSITDYYLEMLKKVEFGVGRDGNVSLPQMHVGPGMAERIKAALDNLSPEHEAEFERITAEKAQEALAREAERKAKFRRAER